MAQRRDIRDLDFDQRNIDKLGARGITPEQARQVLDNRHVVYRNRAQRRATYLLVGLDDGGTCLTLPIEPVVNEPGLWYPVTGWYCKPAEWARLLQQRARQ
jgi:hypothetical protein